MKIIPCGTEHFEGLVGFVVRLNGDDAHHIGFFGEGEADVRSSLAECLIQPAEGFKLAYDGDQLVGVFGLDADLEIGRAWLFGPLIDEYPGWQSLADELYTATMKLIPDGISEQDLFCDVKNLNVAAFAERHGFPLRSENAVVTLERTEYKKPASTSSFPVVDFDPAFFDQFEQCHNLLFPNTYFTARQIVEKLDASRRLFLGLENGMLKGYHFCKVETEARLGYIDFIGVDESVRGHGLGATLLAAGIDWMLSFPEPDKISLTVNADNVPALKLYKNFGFVTERVLRSYRKKGINV